MSESSGGEKKNLPPSQITAKKKNGLHTHPTPIAQPSRASTHSLEANDRSLQLATGTLLESLSDLFV